MNKAELINVVSEKSGTSKKLTKEMLENFLETITEELTKKGEVVLTGFGTFSVTETKARKARNLQTKKPVNVPASTRAKFKIGKNLKEATKGL